MSSSGEVKTGSVPRQCINCSYAVPRNQLIHSLDELSHSALNILKSWIAPGSITDEGILCDACYTLIPRATSEAIPKPDFGHKQVCFVCGMSILRARSYRVPSECPERNVILRWIPVHQVSRLQRVCAACWRAANREVHRQQQQHDGHQSEQQDINWSIDIPVPPPLPPQLIAQHSGATTPIQKITSAVYRRAAATSSHCLFLGCQEPERLLVPKLIREMLIVHNKFYVPTSARICLHHLNNGTWSELTSNLRDFTSTQVDIIFNTLGKTLQQNMDFENIATMAPNICHYWLGMNAQQFEELFTCVPSLLQKLEHPKIALCIYLVKCRTGESNERLSTLFGMAPSILEKEMTIARNCLMEDFVSRYC